VQNCAQKEALARAFLLFLFALICYNNLQASPKGCVNPSTMKKIQRIGGLARMESPLVSIIVPIYNAAMDMVPCLESIKHQRYQNLEVLLVNDGSSDNTWAIISELHELGRSDAWISRHLGMDKDEILRLKQITGLTALFKEAEFGRAWKAIENDLQDEWEDVEK